MNVAYTPRSCATSFTTSRNVITLSAIVERVGVAQVDLVLARAELVEAVLDRDAHRLEREDRLLAQVRDHVELGEVEVAGVVERLGSRRPISEVEELHLGPGVEREALLPRPLEVALQHVARVALERLARRAAGRRRRSGRRARRRRATARSRRCWRRGSRACRTPAPGCSPRSPSRRRSCPPRGRSRARRGDREALQEAEDVGEPEAHEADPALLDRPQHVVQLRLHAIKCGRRGHAAQPGPNGAVTARSHAVHSGATDGEMPELLRTGLPLGATCGQPRLRFQREESSRRRRTTSGEP